jgi:release factor glutamine methyltransferase
MSSNSTQSEPWTILRLLQWTTEHLKKHGSPSPRLDAEVLLAHARGCQRIDLYAAFNEEPPEAVKAIFRDLIKRRAAGEPVAYLVGKKEFYSLSFKVTPDCLIPRGETEHVVIEALDRLKPMRTSGEASGSEIHVVDVCTGSGCIAIALAKETAKFQPLVRFTAIDLSPAALAIAQENAATHGVADRVAFVHADLLESVADASSQFILSNPPYVSQSEFESLDRSVRLHEPHMALVSGPTGMEIIERLIDQSANKLASNGWLILELSPMIAAETLQRLQSDSRWKDSHLKRDLAGHDRIAIAQRSA